MLVSLIVTLIVIGVVLYLVELIPMDATIKRIIQVLVILCVVLWLLSSFGVLPAGFGHLGIVGAVVLRQHGYRVPNCILLPSDEVVFNLDRIGNLEHPRVEVR